MDKQFFYLPVGDFLCTDYWDCERYLAYADKSIDAIRDAHFRIYEETGIDLADFVNTPKDDVIPQNVMSKLKTLGYTFKYELLENDGITHLTDKHTLCDGTDIMADIWVFLLNKVDPELNCQLMDKVPDLLFTGADDKNRYCQNIGLGLFS